MKFIDFELRKEIQQALKEQGFEKPTEIQEKSIPHILDGYDIIAGSKTGSGKTLAFALPAVEFCKAGEGIQTLILTPTRELADQIKDVFLTISKHLPRINVAVIYGGVAYEPQYEALKTADILVATPGRLLDHCNQRKVDLSKVNLLVLDEADRMLEMGFVEDVEEIVKYCPEERQSLLFSATIFGILDNLAQDLLRQPIEINVSQRVEAHKLKQVYYDISERLKASLLIHLMKQERKGMAMIFCNSRHATDIVADALKANGVNALAIHGGFSQNKRTNTMDKFNQNAFQALVCTDVAARGLDVQGVTHVYNYDIPSDSKQYIHRIGRTARAGNAGIAVNLVSPRDYENFDRLLRDNNLNIPKLDKPYVKEIYVSFAKDDKPRRGPGSARRGTMKKGPRKQSFKKPRPSQS